MLHFVLFCENKKVKNVQGSIESYEKVTTFFTSDWAFVSCNYHNNVGHLLLIRLDMTAIKAGQCLGPP